MDGEQHNPTQPLAAIVAGRPPWFRARLSTILVWPTIHGGWTAILSYAHYTPQRPGEVVPHGVHPTYPQDTHHPLAVEGEDARAAILPQVAELEVGGEFGHLTVSRVAAPPWTAPGGPASPGWTILTHSGSEAERRAWQRRIGQAAG